MKTGTTETTLMTCVEPHLPKSKKPGLGLELDFQQFPPNHCSELKRKKVCCDLKDPQATNKAKSLMVVEAHTKKQTKKRLLRTSHDSARQNKLRLKLSVRVFFSLEVTLFTASETSLIRCILAFYCIDYCISTTKVLLKSCHPVVNKCKCSLFDRITSVGPHYFSL